MSNVGRDVLVQGAPEPFRDSGVMMPGAPAIGGWAVPRLPAHMVPRWSLLRRLDRMAPLTVVQALPGFGKTTLVADWAWRLRRGDVVTAWIRLTPELDHRQVLRSVLQLAHRRAGRPLVIVLDDAQHLTSPDAADVLVRAIAASNDLYVVACSDGQQCLTMPAAAHGLDTQVIRGAELALAGDEVREWAAAWGHDLTAEQRDRLVALVGGWILPLRLVLDATPSWDDDFAVHAATDYFERSVLPHISDEDSLRIARRLSLADTVDLPLAGALLRDDIAADGKGQEWAAVPIRMLERSGLLWRAAGHAPAWRFPTLVRRALAQGYERACPEQARADHRVIARVIRSARRQHGTAAALGHARLGQDWPLLARIWLEGSWQLLDLTPADFSAAYADLPDAALRSHPELRLPAALAVAVAETPVGDPDARRRFVLQHYRQVGLDYLRHPTEVSSLGDRIERLIAAVLGLRHEGRLREALAMASRIDRELVRLRSREAWAKRSVQSSWFMLQWGLTKVLAGQRERGIALLVKAYDTSPTSPTGAQSAAAIALSHALSGANRDARRWLVRYDAIEASGWWAQALAGGPAQMARASLALDRLDEEAATSALVDPLHHGDGDVWPAYVWLQTRHALLFGSPFAMLSRVSHVRQIRQIELEQGEGIAGALLDRSRAELLLAIGEVNQAYQLLGDGLEAPPLLRPAAARLHLMIGDPARARRIASASAWTASTERDRAELLMLAAVAALLLGREAEAGATFRQAHVLCEETGILVPYLTPGTEQLEQLLALSGVTLGADVTEAVARTRRPYEKPAAMVELSPREREVLRQIRHHDTAAALARSLSVSVNTVRKQLVSLYAKLDVHDRAAALLVAERLGLLDG